jgi:SAM-dependent methyltransferase
VIEAILMSDWLDDSDALAEQYADASNLNARAALHERYSTADRDLHPWLFDQFDLPPKARVLTLGCGPGTLWTENRERIPDGWDVTLTDFSPGMVETARENLADCSHEFAFEVMNAEDVSFEDETFDAVTANHMLYHVTDRESAFAEIRRVLKPGGRLYASTNGESNMQALFDVMADVAGAELPRASGFDLQNGAAQLDPFFERVERRAYDDGLEVIAVEPLVEYALSRDEFDESDRAALREAFAERFEDGVFRADKDVGVFAATA